MEATLSEGQLVPSVRQVASTLQVNPLTVSRAYQELVDAGFLEKHRGVGMRVASGARRALLAQERKRFLREEWPATVERMRLLGISPPTLCCPGGDL